MGFGDSKKKSTWDPANSPFSSIRRKASAEQAKQEQAAQEKTANARRGQPPKGQQYHAKPDTSSLAKLGFVGGKGVRQVKGKNQVQGGGSLRPRWETGDGKTIEFDRQHGTYEVYDKKGKHIGEFDQSGHMTKGPSLGRCLRK